MISIDPRSGETVQNILNSIFKLYQDYLSEAEKKLIIDETYDLFKGKVKLNPPSLEKMLENIQEQRKFYYFDFFLHILFEQIHNQENFFSKFPDILELFDDHKLIYLRYDMPFYGNSVLYELFYDKSMNFYIRKRYSPDASKQLQNREKQILTNKLSKFIITISDTIKDSILIPYYPMGTMHLFLSSKEEKRQQFELSIIDKTIIFLEIATALNDLHLNNIAHGNLTNRDIFLNSSKDAYIGSFFYDRNSEMSARFGPAFYTRSPEINFRLFKEDTNDLDFNKTKSCDIFSFGVMMYEILSEITVRSRFRKKHCIHNQIINIIHNDYANFILSDENNELFRDDLMQDYKKIIEKCMKNDVNERYSSFKDVIDSIKSSRIYIENKEEIDFRIQNASDSTDYKCKFSDIIESWIRGNVQSKKDIFQFVKECYAYFGLDPPPLEFDKDCDFIKFLYDSLSCIEQKYAEYK